MWWIDTIQMFPGHYYRYRVTGFNAFAAATGELDARFSWRVPNLDSPYFAFRLRPVS